MPSSILQKYEQIFAADPRSRIFVELARALVEHGDPQRAIEVCRTGLEHHPSSILGRVIWGRALLAREDLTGARAQFDEAIALDPAGPYAYNLVGEALFTSHLFHDAVPVLARALELQPADERLRGWLEEARRHSPPDGAPAPPAPAASAPAAGARAAETSPALVALPLLRPPAAALAPPGTPAVPSPPSGDAPSVIASSPPLATPPSGPAVPPPVPARQPPTYPRDEVPRSLLSMIPGGTRPSLAAQAAPGPTLPDEEEAEQITARYERELRERLLSEGEPRPPLWRRHGGWLLTAFVLAVLAGGTYLFLHLRELGRREAVAGAATRARAGLARDTLGSLREAAQVLAGARRSKSEPELTSLAAQVAAVLATEHGDEEARALASRLSGRPEAGDGGRAAAYLLASSPKERMSSEEAILAAPPSSEPLLEVLAGGILARRGEVEAAKGRLELAARANPPLLRALSDLGDLARTAGDDEAALSYYGAALSAHPTHPRSVVGAAEVRLSLGRDLDRARADLEALSADPASVPPSDLRLRYEVVSARVLCALGDPTSAAARLARTAERLGDSALLASTAAEVYLSARAYDRAEAAAARAVAIAPGDTEARVLLARARIGRGRFAEALAATASVEGRAVWLQRAIARYRLGQILEARRELERTARDGKMPAEAAVWYARTEIKLGRAEQARALLEKLSASPSPPSLTSVALGEALEALRRPVEAEAAYRAAVEREPTAPEGHAALGGALLARGAAEEAVPELQAAVAADPSDLEARRTLGQARLATGQFALARAELDAVLLAHPADLDTLALLSAVWLKEGDPREARRAADRGLARAPVNPALLMAAARAALAQGDRSGARSLADRAVRAAGRGPEAPAARAVLVEARRR
ncbi:MAG TPA: tetratricopeptide repeat protein [Anaeromyxobacter sp.]|nr:tetratricopeptide repeat protein [Anaeromyxobacter sp.]